MHRTVALAVLLLVAPSMQPVLGTRAAAATPAATQTEFAGLVDIGGGRRLYLECRGSGGPTVVLEAGYRSPAIVWTEDMVEPGSNRIMVLPGVAADTRVCAYERPGASSVDDAGKSVPSRSDPAPMPRRVEDVVADLHALLHTAGVPGPYVLVGHSLGGLMVRLFASSYPDEVVGLVLVDAWSEGVESFLTPSQWQAYLHVIKQTPSQFAHDRTYETIDFATAAAMMRAAPPIRLMPLSVVSHGKPFGIPADLLGFSPDILERAWSQAQIELAALVPNARQVIATESAHYVQLDQPALVIDAIEQVVAAVRKPASWATPVKS